MTSCYVRGNSIIQEILVSVERDDILYPNNNGDSKTLSINVKMTWDPTKIIALG